ncbi:unnamed protein product [Didymodactylos carnosus]|uniref:Uncharacterized protein n=1 Tax=Didymodactylos carnosus TaxID=1234261 RepID=A0A814WLF8_9BILA|nr:unnamed protein product [Didymodactylos carnosus]CAF1203852.1 unnamed protein product [Didymodactylos carnosus]CAF3730706.1 unnamed protein product [Didymodactylos carnosus]CAF3968267.1 unnamed protein product [Didymodactylos carnosus]
MTNMCDRVRAVLRELKNIVIHEKRVAESHDRLKSVDDLDCVIVESQSGQIVNFAEVLAKTDKKGFFENVPLTKERIEFRYSEWMSVSKSNRLKSEKYHTELSKKVLDCIENQKDKLMKILKERADSSRYYDLYRKEGDRLREIAIAYNSSIEGDKYVENFDKKELKSYKMCFALGAYEQYRAATRLLERINALHGTQPEDARQDATENEENMTLKNNHGEISLFKFVRLQSSVYELGIGVNAIIKQFIKGASKAELESTITGFSQNQTANYVLLIGEVLLREYLNLGAPSHVQLDEHFFHKIFETRLHFITTKVNDKLSTFALCEPLLNYFHRQLESVKDNDVEQRSAILKEIANIYRTLALILNKFHRLNALPEWNNASDYYKEVLKLSSKDQAARLSFVRCLLSFDKYKKAVKVLKITEDCAEKVYLLELAKGNMRSYQDARENVQKAIDSHLKALNISETDQTALLNFARGLLEFGRYLQSALTLDFFVFANKQQQQFGRYRAAVEVLK